MNLHEFPHELAFHKAKELSRKCYSSMGLNPTEIFTSFENNTADEIWLFLEEHTGDQIVVAGDWRINTSFDVYDIVLRFAERNFSRIQQQKFPAGPFIVVMADPLEDILK